VQATDDLDLAPDDGVRLPVLFLGFFLPPFLLLTAVSLFLYLQDLGKEKQIHEREGRHLVELQGEILANEFTAVESDLLYLRGQSRLHDLLNGDRAAAADLAQEYLLFISMRRLYDQVRYLDASGHEVIRVDYHDGAPAIVPPDALQLKAGRYYFQAALALDRAELYVSPFDLNIEHGQIQQPWKPVIRFATPLFDDRGEKRGLLILNYLGNRLLQRLRDVAANYHGASWLVNAEGYWLIGRRPAEEWGFMFGRDSRFQDDFPEAWRRIGAAERGQFSTDEGLFTFATIARGGPLKVIAFEPARVVGASSRLLFRKLLSMFVLVSVLLVVLSWFLARGRLIRRRNERQLLASEAQLRLLSNRLVNAQEEERRRIARDLHDDLGQIVTSVSLDLQRAVQQDRAEARGGRLERALHGTQLLLERVHEIAHQLRPAILDDLGLRDAARSLVSDFEAATGINVQLELNFAHDHIPAEVSQNIFRILQEALTNIARHASTSEASVRLEVAADAVSLTVQDDGIGIQQTPRHGSGLGIPGMQERARLLGGVCQVSSKAGEGTCVRVTVPLRSSPDPEEASGRKDRE